MDVLAALLLLVMVSTFSVQTTFNSPMECLLKNKIWKFFKKVSNYEKDFNNGSVLSCIACQDLQQNNVAFYNLQNLKGL